MVSVFESSCLRFSGCKANSAISIHLFFLDEAAGSHLLNKNVLKGAHSVKLSLRLRKRNKTKVYTPYSYLNV